MSRLWNALRQKLGIRQAVWEEYDGDVNGLLIAGDPDVPPTTDENFQHLLKHVWKTVVVLVPVSRELVFPGFVPVRGPKQVWMKGLQGKFRMRVGHEPVIFFVVDEQGRELPLVQLDRTTINNPRYKDVPLL